MKTRILLSVSVSGAALALAVFACVVQSHNHSRAAELARRQREFEMLDAANAQANAVVSAHVWGVPNEQLDITRSRSRARAAGGGAQ